MKAKDFDLSLIQALLDRINESGCTYAHFDITSGRGEVRFNIYTPETGHAPFTDFSKLVHHMERIASSGEGSVAIILAQEKLLRLKATIAEDQEELSRTQAFLDSKQVDSDGIPL